MKITVKKGLDLNIAGAATVPSDSGAVSLVAPRRIAIVPDDFVGLTPKLDVKEGDSVMIGSPLLHDKVNTSLKVVSPVCGTVTAVVRGLRRKIERVELAPDSGSAAVKFDTAGDVRTLLMESGLWAMMRQRPYDVVPDPSSDPRDIFVTAFDSAPLAPVLTFGMQNASAELDAGIKALAGLTRGKVYIGVRSQSDIPSVTGAEIVEVAGPHPAGNAGVQIAAIAPVNKGETVWTLDIVTLRKIGHLMINGSVDPGAIVALTGGEVETPHYVATVPGCDMESIIGAGLKSLKDAHHRRVISGNVLTGQNVGMEGFLRWPYRQVTVIPEGDDVDEFLGWANPGAGKMSVKRSFIGHFLSGKKFNPDARIKGGRRAMILSGEYDRVLPMDILGEYLVKAIIAKDIDKMEQLGIYEVAPEDFALPEYVDTSKLELQKIVREGLDYVRKELA